MAKTNHPDHDPDRPDRPDHDLPGRRPGTHPDQDLPGEAPPGRGPRPDHDLPEGEKPAQPKGRSGRAAREGEEIPPEPEPPPPPVLTGLLPTFATLGDPNFALRVIGSGFTPDSIIVFAEQDEPVTYLSPSDMTTGVDMALWLGPDPAIPVKVRNADGQESETLTFEFKAPLPVEALPPDPAQASKPIPDLNLITPM